MARDRDDEDRGRKDREEGKRRKSSRRGRSESAGSDSEQLRERRAKKKSRHGATDKRRQRSASRESSSASSSSDSDSRRSRKQSKSKKKKKSKDKKERDRKDKKDKRKKGKSSKGSDEEEIKVTDEQARALNAKGTKPLTEDDYYQKATEFRIWLKKERNLYFEDLTSEEAAKLFKKFAKRWNSLQLPSSYYEGLPEDVVEGTERTRHKWKFLGNLSEREKFALASTADSVKAGTKKIETLAGQPAASGRVRSREDPRPPRGDTADRRYQEEAEQEGRRRDAGVRRREDWKRTKDILEDVAPKAYGREAQIEKRKEKGAKIHGSARDRDEAMDGLDVKEDTLMGGGDDFQSRMRRHQARKEARLSDQKEKLAAFQNAEEEKMKKFLQDMGLQPGQKVTIAPRQ